MTHLSPVPDSTEPRDEDLDVKGRDDQGVWIKDPRVGVYTLVGLVIIAAIAGVMGGIAFAVGARVYRFLT